MIYTELKNTMRPIAIFIGTVISVAILFGPRQKIEVGNELFLIDLFLTLIVTYAIYQCAKLKISFWSFEHEPYNYPFNKLKYYLVFISAFIFVMSCVSYLNQYNVNSPIKTAHTVISRVRHQRLSHNFIYANLPIGEFSMNDEALYRAVTPGSAITVNYRQGRLGSYFILSLTIEKTGEVITF